MKYFLLIGFLLLINRFSFCQTIDCNGLVSIFLKDKAESKNLLSDNKWVLYDSADYTRSLPGKEDEQKLFYRKQLGNAKIFDSIVFITHYKHSYNFMDTAVGVRKTLVQFKTYSKNTYGQIKKVLEQSGKLLFDTAGEYGTYRYYEYEKAVVNIFEPTGNPKNDIYLFWVFSRYAFETSRPSVVRITNRSEPHRQSNQKARVCLHQKTQCRTAVINNYVLKIEGR